MTQVQKKPDTHMKLINRLSILSIILYIAGLLLTVYYLNNWSYGLVFMLQVTDTGIIRKLNENTIELFFVVGTQSGLGVISILLLLLSSRIQTNVIYVEKASGSQKQSVAETVQTSIEVQKPDENPLLQEIKELLKSKRTPELLEQVLRKICTGLEAVQGALYILKEQNGANKMFFACGYAFYVPESRTLSYEPGEGLVGQAAKSGEQLLLSEIPEGYLNVVSGLGQGSPKTLLLTPIKNEDHIILGVLETASFTRFSNTQQTFLKEVALLLAIEIMEGEYVSS